MGYEGTSRQRFLVAESPGVVQPDQGRAPKIIPEPPVEQRSRPGRYLPVITKDCNSRILRVATQPSEPCIFFSNVAKQGGTAGVPLVPIYNVWTRGFFIEGADRNENKIALSRK